MDIQLERNDTTDIFLSISCNKLVQFACMYKCDCVNCDCDYVMYDSRLARCYIWYILALGSGVALGVYY